MNLYLRLSPLNAAFSIRRVCRFWVAVILCAQLCLPAGGIALAQTVADESNAASRTPEDERRVQALIVNEKAKRKLESLPKPKEFYQPGNTRVKAHGGRISLRDLDLSRTPTEEELCQSGQLGSRLSPAYSADHTKISHAGKRRKQEADNLLFGEAMQDWNQHHYPSAVKLFRKHRSLYPESPWAGEAVLHLGCNAQFSGSWEEAKFSFEWILKNQPEGSEIYQKAKLRRAVLHLEQGELDEATAGFSEIQQTDKVWERKTYAGHWLQQLNHLKSNEVALRDCGKESIAYVLRARGAAEKGEQAKAKVAPSEKGFSMGELSVFASECGLEKTQAVRMGFGELDKIGLPMVAHYSDRHFVVVSGTTADGTLRVYDPRLKRETELSRQQFAAQWSGLALIFGEVPAGARLATTAELQDNYGGCCGLPRSESGLGPTTQKPSCGLPVWSVNPVSMNLVVEDTPMWFNEPMGPDVMLRLTYNSQDSLNQLRPFGNKWTFDYASYALESPSQGGAGTVLVLMPGGRRDNFNPNTIAAGETYPTYTSADGSVNTLRKTGAYAFELKLPDGTIYKYGPPENVAGTTSLLLSIRDRNGIALNVDYSNSGQISGIRDYKNRSWTFLYNLDGYVSGINDPFGRTATFTYAVNGALVAQKDMGGLVYSYEYDSDYDYLNGNFFLTAITKPSGKWSFYIEPADGKPNGANGYPEFGGDMWENYRITIADPLSNKEEYYYDGLHRQGWYRDKVQYATDALPTGPKTTFNYVTVVGGKEGLISRIAYSHGQVISYAGFNEQRLPTTISDSGTGTSTLAYNTLGRVLTSTDNLGNVTTFTYANNGWDLLAVTNPLGTRSLELQYNTKRNLIRSIDAPGVVSAGTGALGRATQLDYQTLVAADGVSYERLANITAAAHNPELAPTQRKTLNYNSSDQLTSVTQNGEILTELTYDGKGRVASRRDASGFTTAYTYDDNNRLLRTIFPDGTYTENQWGCCVLERARDRAGLSTQFIHDALGNITSVIDPAARVSTFTYDQMGHLLQMRDPNQRVTTWEWNARYQLKKKTYADNTSQSYTYNDAGRITTFTDARGNTSWFGYDGNQNLTQVNVPGLPVVDFSYDKLNRRSEMVDQFGTWVYSYNTVHELTSAYNPIVNKTFNYRYDDLGRVLRRDFDGDDLRVSYDLFNRPVSQTNELGLFQYTYYGAVSSQLGSIWFPNGQTSSYSWYGDSVDQRLREIWNRDGADNALSKFDYVYKNATGEISKWTQQAGAGVAVDLELGYDSIHQLTSAAQKNADVTRSLLKTFTYAYDAGGNRVGETIDTSPSLDSINAVNQLLSRQAGVGVIPIQGSTNKASSVKVNGVPAQVNADNTFAGLATVSAGTQTIVTVEATDQANRTTTQRYQVQVVGTGAGVRSLSYDLNGNEISDGEKTYEWDTLNRLTAINIGDHRSEFSYNGAGQRVKMLEKESGVLVSEKWYVWAPGGSQPMQERDSSKNITKRFYKEGVKIGGESLFYTHDHLGSVREVTDWNGAVRARYQYDPYGRRTKVDGVAGDFDADFGYTGHYHHVRSGLNLTLFRAYDADLGRWQSRDPLGEEGGINLYGYVGNNPINAVDPLGLMILLPSDAPGVPLLSPKMYSDAADLRRQGHQQFPSEANSAARHQWASKQLAMEYGNFNARVFGVANEVQGFLWHDIWRLPSRFRGDTPWAFQLDDLINNERGFNRADCERATKRHNNQPPPQKRPSWLSKLLFLS